MRIKVGAKQVYRILVPLFLIVVSMTICASRIPETSLVQGSIRSLENSRATVTDFAAATLATSVAISALPGDFATPIANDLASMDKYFVGVLVVILVEKLILTNGIPLVFRYIIPLALLAYIIYVVTGKQFVKNCACKIGILGAALLLAVPLGTNISDKICAEQINYVNQTIEDAKHGADIINDLSSEDDEKSMLDKLSDAFSTAMDSVNDLLDYMYMVIKKCMGSIAILIVAVVVIPLAVFWFFLWLLNVLFDVRFPTSRVVIKKKNGKNTIEVVEGEI